MSQILDIEVLTWEGTEKGTIGVKDNRVINISGLSDEATYAVKEIVAKDEELDLERMEGILVIWMPGCETGCCWAWRDEG